MESTTWPTFFLLKKKHYTTGARLYEVYFPSSLALPPVRAFCSNIPTYARSFIGDDYVSSLGFTSLPSLSEYFLGLLH
jgi:hypothetical protein